MHSFSWINTPDVQQRLQSLSINLQQNSYCRLQQSYCLVVEYYWHFVQNLPVVGYHQHKGGADKSSFKIFPVEFACFLLVWSHCVLLESETLQASYFVASEQTTARADAGSRTTRLVISDSMEWKPASVADSQLTGSLSKFQCHTCQQLHCHTQINLRGFACETSL